MQHGLRLLRILGLHLLVIHASPVPMIEGGIEGGMAGNRLPTASRMANIETDFLSPPHSCSAGDCSTILSVPDQVKPATGRDTKLPATDDILLSDGSKLESIIAGSKKTTIRLTDPPTFPLVARIKKSLQAKNVVRHQWFKYTVGSENQILKVLQLVQKEKGVQYPFVSDLIERISTIQSLRTDLDEYFGVAHVNSLNKDFITHELETKKAELQSVLLDFSKNPYPERDVRMWETVFGMIKQSESLKLEGIPNLEKFATVSQMQSSWILPPSREAKFELIKDMFRFTTSVRRERAAYLATYRDVTFSFLRSLSNSKYVRQDVQNLAREIHITMEKDVIATIHTLNNGAYEKYSESTKETMDLLSRIAELSAKDESGQIKNSPEIRKYIIYQGMVRGPMIFSKIDPSMPEVQQAVKEALASVFPPNSWRKSLAFQESILGEKKSSPRVTPINSAKEQSEN